MAIEKILQTRIMNKVDTLENWGKSALKIKQGEICFATVAATAGNGLTEPVIMAKIGTAEEKTFAELPWSFYAKASDVLSACKSEDTLKAFINGVIADAGLATDDAMTALADRVTTTEGEIETLKGDENTAGSVAKAIKDAIDALDLANTFNGKVDKVEGKSLVADTEITKLAGVSEGANKVEKSDTNGNIKVDGAEVVVYTHPEKHAIADVTGLSDAIADAKKAGTDATAALGAYKTVNDAAVQDNADAIDAIEASIGDVAEGKTVVEMIADAQTAATYDDTALTNRVKAIEDDYLVEADKTELSNAITAEKERAEGIEGGLRTDVDAIKADYLKAADKEALQTQINTIMNNPDAEGAINSINEFTQYVADHGTIADGFRTDIDKNKDDIAAEVDRATKAEEALSGRVEALEAIDHSHDNKELLDTYTQTEVDLADAVTKKHSHANATVLDGIKDTDIVAWNAKVDAVTASADSGLKATRTDNTIAIEIDDSLTFIFDCGNSGVVAE